MQAMLESRQTGLALSRYLGFLRSLLRLSRAVMDGWDAVSLSKLPEAVCQGAPSSSGKESMATLTLTSTTHSQAERTSEHTEPTQRKRHTCKHIIGVLSKQMNACAHNRTTE